MKLFVVPILSCLLLTRRISVGGVPAIFAVLGVCWMGCLPCVGLARGGMLRAFCRRRWTRMVI